jgi:hypothetical protein
MKRIATFYCCRCRVRLPAYPFKGCEARRRYEATSHSLKNIANRLDPLKTGLNFCAGCCRLWRVVVGCGRLWRVVAGCGWLWRVVAGCGGLLQVVTGCGSLWRVVAGCGGLWWVVAGCGKKLLMGIHDGPHTTVH